MYIVGKSRTQLQIGYSLEGEIKADNEVRVIDAFVDALDMVKCGFVRAIPASEGRPGFNPADLVKLYVYGNLNGVRSSRKLAKECTCNIEVKWLLNELEPDFRTISDFRKDNANALKNVFREFNRFIRGKCNSELYSVDGSKFKASNNRDKTFTASELDERIARLTIKIDDYLRQLDAEDQIENNSNGSKKELLDNQASGEEESLNNQVLGEENSLNNQVLDVLKLLNNQPLTKETSTCDQPLTKEELLEIVNKLKERLNNYQNYQDELQKTGKTQISLTDPDAKLMRTNNGYCVGYNVQTAVDIKHYIADFLVVTNSTDHGQMLPTLTNIRQETTGTIINATGDKGYEKPEDIIACLQNGIIPNVIPSRGKDSYKLEIEYEPTMISEAALKSTNPEVISKMLKSGVIPEALKDVLSDVKIIDKKEKITDEFVYDPKMSIQEYLEEAKKGYFIRDIQEDKVYCPAGQILRRAAIRANNAIKYRNKKACEKCPFRNKCTKSNYREVIFQPKQCRVIINGWNKQDTKCCQPKRIKTNKLTITKKMVSFVFHPIKRFMDKRKELSEHPFGTIKRTFNGSYYLTRGKKLVEAETAMLCLAYNIRHAVKTIGVPELLKAIRAFARKRVLFSFWGLFFGFMHPRKTVKRAYHMVEWLFSDATLEIPEKAIFCLMVA